MTREDIEKKMHEAAEEIKPLVTTLVEALCGAHQKGYLAGVELGAKMAYPQWIPVEEELPKLTIDDWRSEDVFFATDDGKSHFGFYSNKCVWFSSVYGFNGHQVTHWMPLPQPPRKEVNND